MSPPEPTNDRSLNGLRIVVPETRSLALFADMLERRGAIVRRCPLIRIVDSHDSTSIEAWLQRCINGQFDELVLLTGEGLRRLSGFAKRAAIDDEFHASLAKLRTITRGPKPGKALRDLGLRPHINAPEPTTAGVIQSLQTLGENGGLESHRIGLQFYGDEANSELTDVIEAMGATADPVWPYRYEDAVDDETVREIIDEMIAGDADAIAFTSAPQVRRLLAVAQASERDRELRQSLATMTVSAVGPLVAAALSDENITVDVMPQSSFFMKPLVNALATHYADRH